MIINNSMDNKTEQDLIWQSLDDAFPAVPVVYKTDLNEELSKLERGCIENALEGERLAPPDVSVIASGLILVTYPSMAPYLEES